MSALEDEKAALGAILSGHPNPGDLFAILNGSDFEEPKHELIWHACHELVNTGKTPDPITVRAALGKQAETLPGGSIYLAELMQQAPVVSSGTYYAEQVRDAALRRRIGTASARIGQMAQEVTDVVELADRARAEIDKATDTGRPASLVRLSETLPHVLDIAEKGHVGGLTTGWPGIDRLTRGLQPGRFIVVGARPGVGKSIMGTNLAHCVAYQHRKAALICSMEMPAHEVTQRIMAHHATVPLGPLDSGQVSDAAWDKIARAQPEFDQMAIYINDSSEQTLTSIRSEVTRIKKQRDDLALVVVDYLQLMKGRDDRPNRAEQVGEMSRGLKVIAREFELTVVAMAQLNRASAQRAGGKPILADLRESGSIEADADIVILLHREDNPDGTPGTEVEALIEKNRAGQRGFETLQLQGHYARLAERAWSPSQNIA